MKGAMSANYVMREAILGLLSDEELARVSTAEAAGGLAAGDEYIDLHDLERGVLRANDAVTVADNVLPRKAVQESTWKAILRKVVVG